jgi:hypothetical protein
MAPIRLRLFILVALLGSLGCKTDDTSNNPQEVPADLVAADYIDQSDNLIWEALIKGSSIIYDSTGKQVSKEEGESNNKATIGASTVVGGFNVRPLYVYDADGGRSGEGPLCYIGMINGNFCFLTEDDQVVTVLPKQVKIGEWTPSSKIPTLAKSEFKIVEYFPTFTNGAGKKYEKVIKTSASYEDSVWSRSEDFHQQNDVQLDIYYAKGVGPIEIEVHKYEQEELNESTRITRARHISVGTASRTND